MLYIVIVVEFILLVIFYLPNIFGIKSYVITSGSMKPKYDIGSLIYVKKTSPYEVKEKDAITFYMTSSKIVATHEVYKIDKENEKFYTRGINNKDDKGNIVNDAAPVPFSRLIGKTVFSIPYIGYVNRFITSSPGIYLVIFMTLILIVVSFLLDKKKNMED